MSELDYVVLWENEDYLVINKPAGIASQSSNQTVESVWTKLEKSNKQHYHLSNRLDQPVSGCLAFSKHKDEGFAKQPIHKVYVAIVEKKKEIDDQGTLIDFIKRVPAKSKSICSDEKKEGFKKAVLHYTVLKVLDNYIILKIILRTGRFHQIRSQLSHFGLPIKGDVKYGARRKNNDRSIHLHAREIKLYPNTEEEQSIQADFPKDVLWDEAATVI